MKDMTQNHIFKRKVRLDWAAQQSGIDQMKREQIANMALWRGAQSLVKMRGYEEFVAKQALGPTTSDYAYIADFARRLIYKHADDLSWVNSTLGNAPLSTLDLTFEFNSDVEISGPLDEMDQGRRTVLTWTKFDLRLEKYVGRFLVSDAARARGRSNIQALTTLKRQAEELNIVKERKSVDQLYLHAGNTGAAGAVWDNASATIEIDIGKAIGTILNAADSLAPKRLDIVVLLPAAQWLFLTAQQATLNLSVLEHYKKTLTRFEIIPTKYWSATASTGIQDDALIYVRGAGTGVHGYAANVPFPLVEKKRIETAGTEYFWQHWMNTVTIPDSKTTTTSSRIYKLTAVVGT